MEIFPLKFANKHKREQKQLAAKRVADALVDAIGCNACHVSVSVEDFTPQEWQTVYQQEVTENDALVLRPNYNPEDVL